MQLLNSQAKITRLRKPTVTVCADHLNKVLLALAYVSYYRVQPLSTQPSGHNKGVYQLAAFKFDIMCPCVHCLTYRRANGECLIFEFVYPLFVTYSIGNVCTCMSALNGTI